MFQDPAKGQKKFFYDFAPENESLLRVGLDYQREHFKRANLMNDYERMVKALENILAEIKSKSIAKGNKKSIERVQKIIAWYKKLPMTYSRRTEEGMQIKYPANLSIRISKNLNIAYELIIEQLTKLGLI